MRPVQFRLNALVGLVMGVGIVCGYVVTWSRWQPRPSPPSERIVAAVLASRSSRSTTGGSSRDDLALPLMSIIVVLAVSRARRRLVPTTDLAPRDTPTADGRDR